ncbi:MAG: AAA family ATPase, partial [Acidimicrobiia bacterium]|nr:AAA family ATPase [Acidimicrobiia bacterium]
MAPDTDDTRVGSSYDDFSWTSFYSEFANRLLTYRHDRPALLAAIDQLPAERVSYLTDRFADGSSGRMRDICPFTTMGAFNRRLTDANRRTTALKLAEFLGMEREPLRSFAGIPILDNRASWFFPYEGLRDDDHIDALWQVFADAIAYADGPDKPNRASLIDSFNDAVGRKHVRRKLTMGLYWIRPWTFVPLDWYSREFIGEWLDVDVSRVPAGETYLDLCDELLEMFNDESMPVHSFPELSLGAWEEDESEEESDDEPEDETEDEPDATADNTDESPPSEEPVRPYSVDDVIAEGCFLDRSRLEAILDRWRVKKNLILQGPPGTGKTWLAKRLAFALIGYRSLQRVRPVQFHPNLSYEDFVRGWRPSGDSEGRLKLLDGPFLRAVEDAANDPARDHVVVIEEINRGNPAQIFGEMLTLLEADKRNADEALELSYPRRSGERVHIPGNLFVVGTMNIADRSLALV